jgi:hypothetical protein
LLFLYRTCKLYGGLQCRFAEPLAANPFSCYIYPCVAAVGGGGGGLGERERVGGVLSIAVFVFVSPVYLDVERRRGFGS